MAFALAGKATAVVANVNVVLAASLSIVVPAGLVKVLWDRAQKRRLRARITALEDEIRTLEQRSGG